jgi:hypothetical protein
MSDITWADRMSDRRVFKLKKRKIPKKPLFHDKKYTVLSRNEESGRFDAQKKCWFYVAKEKFIRSWSKKDDQEAKEEIIETNISEKEIIIDLIKNGSYEKAMKKIKLRMMLINCKKWKFEIAHFTKAWSYEFSLLAFEITIECGSYELSKTLERELMKLYEKSVDFEILKLDLNLKLKRRKFANMSVIELRRMLKEKTEEI